jgi:osmoprotectant transport system ATP-binding protein
MSAPPAPNASESHVGARQAATLEFRETSKTYDGATEAAIQSLSLTVPAGEVLVLVGPSGCGKTTAMRLVNRMIEPTGGDILLDGVSVLTRDPSELRREVGYAIQQIGLFPHRSVADNIATVPRLLGWDKARIDARVIELLELVDLPVDEVRDRYPAQLSGGQRQRVGVARAIAADPPLLLMDEPFGAIDPITRDRLQNEFLRLQQEIRKTVVFVTHDIDEAIKIGDRIAVLRKGGVLAQYATPEQLLLAPADDFVEDFVGADRGLKRLALQRVSDVDLWRAPLVRAGRPTSEARAAIDASEVPYGLLVDDADRPVGWLDERALRLDVVPATAGSAVVTVEPEDVLRDALSHLLQEGVQYGAVVDRGGAIIGILSITLIEELLRREGRLAQAKQAEHGPAGA